MRLRDDDEELELYGPPPPLLEPPIGSTCCCCCIASRIEFINCPVDAPVREDDELEPRFRFTVSRTGPHAGQLASRHLR